MTDQTLDNLEQFFDDNGDALVTEQLCDDTEVRRTDESRVQRVDDTVTVAQTLPHTTPLTAQYNMTSSWLCSFIDACTVWCHGILLITSSVADSNRHHLHSSFSLQLVI